MLILLIDNENRHKFYTSKKNIVIFLDIGLFASFCKIPEKISSAFKKK